MRSEPSPTSFDALRALSAPEAFQAFLDAGDLRNDLRLRSLWDEYRSWPKVRYIALDAELNPVKVWRAVKASRLAVRQTLKLSQADGHPFCICSSPLLAAGLHRIDRATGGGGAAALESKNGALSDEDRRLRLRLKTLMDEAAESSIIEGAATTRKNAVEMLRAGRTPRDKAERMVLNNYIAMQEIKRRLDRPLSTEMLIELQALLTDGTNPPAERGRLRRPDEDIRVVDHRDDNTIFTPPPAESLPDRLLAFCNFANATHDGADFLHPLVKASILHFMIGYEHPFVDGNGRTARAVFYWHALKHGYTIFEYLSISEIIRKGFARYPQAYLDTEQDDGDLTYFVLYKLDVIEQSLVRLTQNLRDEEDRISRSQRILKAAKDLNLRQRLLLEHMIRHPTTVYTVKSHANSNGITLMTARADLDGLARRRFVTKAKRGKEVIYHPAHGLQDRLARKGV